MSFGDLAPDLYLRVMKSLSVGGYGKQLAILDLLACKRTCRALRTAASDEAVWHCVSLMSTADDDDDVLEAKYTGTDDGHQATELWKKALRDVRSIQKSKHCITMDVFDHTRGSTGILVARGGRRQWHGHMLPQWRAWCGKLFKQFNKDDRIVEPLLLTPRAGELLANYAEAKMIPFLNACIRVGLNRYEGSGPEFELLVKDIQATDAVRQDLLLETLGSASSGLRASTAYTPYGVNPYTYTTDIPVDLGGPPPASTVFEPLKMEDDYAGHKQLILRISRRAGITRMSFDCFELLFQRFQLIVAKVLVPAAIVLFERTRPKTALEVLADAKDAAEFSDEDGDDDDEEEEEDDDDDDSASEDNPESDEEGDPFDVLDAPGTLVADKDFLRQFLDGQVYGFGSDWANLCRDAPDGSDLEGEDGDLPAGSFFLHANVAAIEEALG